jgi:glutamyl/glutaminyl-tRNA synthetase
LISNKDGSKLSKRDHAIGISHFRENIVVPAALNNWVALAGCSMRRGNSELFPTMRELVENVRFDPS